MSGLALHLQLDRWRDHQRRVADDVAGLVPVAKGNGYGFGVARLAKESSRLGADVLAVGQAEEVAAVREGFEGSVVVLTPWRPHHELATELLADDRVITTVSRISDLQEIAARGGRPRVIIELLTSMSRYGLPETELSGLGAVLDQIRFEGWTIHLPINPDGRLAEAERLTRSALATRPGPVWLSHLPVEDTAQLVRTVGSVEIRSRIGTRLWLGDPASLHTTAVVLDVHEVTRGERAGYRGRRSPADGYVLVLAGGTAHGVGLEAPTSAVTLRQRLVSVATGSLEAAGFALSPYTVDGKKRWFVEPPHMQSSLVFLPRSATPPPVGGEVPIELRLTTAVVDKIIAT